MQGPPAPPRSAPLVVLPSATILRTLTCAITLLVVAHVVAMSLYRAGVRPSGNRPFNLDVEANIPTWFSAAQLLLASSLLGLLAAHARREGRADARQWALLALLFAALSFDEVGSFHERLIKPMRSLLGAENLGLFHFAWVIPAMAFVALCVLYFGRFVLRLPAPLGRRMIIAGSVYVGGAVGMEMLGGMVSERHGQEVLSYLVVMTIEETAEMTGVLLLIRGLLHHLDATSPGRPLLALRPLPFPEPSR